MLRNLLDVTERRKERNFLFFFIIGDDPQSCLIEGTVIQDNRLTEQSSAIASDIIVLQESSEDAQMFFRIYQRVNIPSMYLIGRNGLPVCINEFIDLNTTDDIIESIINQLKTTRVPVGYDPRTGNVVLFPNTTSSPISSLTELTAVVSSTNIHSSESDLDTEYNVQQFLQNRPSQSSEQRVNTRLSNTSVNFADDECTVYADDSKESVHHSFSSQAVAGPSRENRDCEIKFIIDGEQSVILVFSAERTLLRAIHDLIEHLNNPRIAVIGRGYPRVAFQSHEYQMSLGALGYYPKGIIHVQLTKPLVQASSVTQSYTQVLYSSTMIGLEWISDMLRTHFPQVMERLRNVYSSIRDGIIFRLHSYRGNQSDENDDSDH